MSHHVPGIGWVYHGLDLLPRVYRAGFETEDYETVQARMAAYRERCERERLAVKVREPWPEPEVPMRVIAPGSVPGAVARLLSVLQSEGWRSVVTYARGTTFDAQRRPGRVVGSFALRSSRGSRRAVAIWWQDRAGRLTSQKVLVFGDRPAQWIGVQEFERGL